jgi:hypothetical protein
MPGKDHSSHSLALGAKEGMEQLMEKGTEHLGSCACTEKSILALQARKRKTRNKYPDLIL